MITNNKETDNNFKFLIPLGWNSHFQLHFDKKRDGILSPARVVGVQKNSFVVNQGNKEISATVAGRINHKKSTLFPVIGDWVTIADKVIYEVLPRQNALSRGAAGTHCKTGMHPGKEQIIAANIDTVFVVSGTDRDFNIRRIERYLTLIYNCGLNPVIVLTKADLHQNPEDFKDKVETIAFGVPVHLVSAKESHGLVQLETYISQHRTICMIGSSGAGKSTLLNRLNGKTVQTTNPVSEKIGKGKHTTTSRSLIMMPQGGMVIDNPGIREIGLWHDNNGLDDTYPEIENLAKECRFRDCTHSHEPGCKVLQGLDTGEVEKERLDNYKKMKRELAYLSDRQQKTADRLEKERWKDVSLKIRAMKKIKGQ